MTINKDHKPPWPSYAWQSRPAFCWMCGQRLRGGQFTARLIDGDIRTLHKKCAEAEDKGERPPVICDWEEEMPR